MTRLLEALGGCLLAAAPLFAGDDATFVFRAGLTPEAVVPAVRLAGASGTATMTVRLGRDGRGAIVDATVLLEVEAKLPRGAEPTALRIHNAPAGSAGPVVLDAGPAPAAADTGRITRIIEVSGGDPNALAALRSLVSRPELYYINVSNAARPNGVLRGQLLPARSELHATLDGPAGVGAARVIVQAARDGAGAVRSGNIAFELACRLAAEQKIAGLRLRSAGTILDSGIDPAHAITASAGQSALFRVVDVAPSNGTGVQALAALLRDPTTFSLDLDAAGRAQAVLTARLERDDGQRRALESVHFHSTLASRDAPGRSASVWLTLEPGRDTGGNPTAARALFDADMELGEVGRVTRLELRRGAAQRVLDAGIAEAAPLQLESGRGNLLRAVEVDPARLEAILRGAGKLSLALETTAGVLQGALAPAAGYLSCVKSGGGWTTAITLANPSAVESACGVMSLTATDGGPIPDSAISPVVPFCIEPAGAARFLTRSAARRVSGYARVYSRLPVTAEAAYFSAERKSTRPARAVVAGTVSLAVTLDREGGRDVEIAVVALEETGTHLVLTLTDESGLSVPDGSRYIALAQGEAFLGLLGEIVPQAAPFRGFVTIERQWGSFPAGRMAVTALEIQRSAIVPIEPKILR